jgi:hypothetical protein
MKAFAIAIILFIGVSQLHAEEDSLLAYRFCGIFTE